MAARSGRSGNLINNSSSNSNSSNSNDHTSNSNINDTNCSNNNNYNSSNNNSNIIVTGAPLRPPPSPCRRRSPSRGPQTEPNVRDITMLLYMIYMNIWLLLL